MSDAVEELKEAMAKFIDAIATEFRLYKILDWLNEKVKKWFDY